MAGVGKVPIVPEDDSVVDDNSRWEISLVASCVSFYERGCDFFSSVVRKLTVHAVGFGRG